jgi:hypothetical protein
MNYCLLASLLLVQTVVAIDLFQEFKAPALKQKEFYYETVKEMLTKEIEKLPLVSSASLEMNLSSFSKPETVLLLVEINQNELQDKLTEIKTEWEEKIGLVVSLESQEVAHLIEKNQKDYFECFKSQLKSIVANSLNIENESIELRIK